MALYKKGTVMKNTKFLLITSLALTSNFIAINGAERKRRSDSVESVKSQTAESGLFIDAAARASGATSPEISPTRAADAMPSVVPPKIKRSQENINFVKIMAYEYGKVVTEHEAKEIIKIARKCNQFTKTTGPFHLLKLTTEEYLKQKYPV
jgi:hypothetical protein